LMLPLECLLNNHKAWEFGKRDEAQKQQPRILKSGPPPSKFQQQIIEQAYTDGDCFHAVKCGRVGIYASRGFKFKVEMRGNGEMGLLVLPNRGGGYLGMFTCLGLLGVACFSMPRFATW
jgi:hypothetical protein